MWFKLIGTSGDPRCIPMFGVQRLPSIIRTSFPKTGIIATSIFSDFSIVDNVIHAGADQFIMKPFKINKLSALIANSK